PGVGSGDGGRRLARGSGHAHGRRVHERPRHLRRRALLQALDRRDAGLHGERDGHGVRREARGMSASAEQLLAARAAGAVFGLGLALSDMVNPARVVGFLDVAGKWDPTLLFVMGGALAVAIPGFRWIPKRPRPQFAGAFSLPTKTDLEPRLIVGAAIFGVGWGLSGLCPGPAVTDLVTLSAPVAAFLVAMLAGAFTYDRWASRKA